MAHPGIPRTPQRDAARLRSKAAGARAFSTVSQLTDIHRLANALCSTPLLRGIVAVRQF